MITYLDDIYFEKLEKYVGKKLKIFKGENEIEFYADVEIQYILEEKDKIYSFYIVERGKRSKLAEYFSEKEMKRNLAINIGGLFGETIDYNKSEEFNNIKDLKEGKKLMELYIEPEYYSIMNPQALKINLEQGEEKDTYNIYILTNRNEKRYIEKNIDICFAFSRFYNEALFLKVSLQRVKEYELVFEDKLSEEEFYDFVI